MLKILFDNSVRHHAVAIKGEWQSTGIQYWGEKIPIKAGTIGSELELIKTKQGSHAGAIAAIRKECVNHNIKAYTSDALNFETFHQPSGRFNGINYGDSSLLSGVEFEEIKSLDEFSFAIPNDDVTQKLREYLDQSQNSSFQEIKSSLPEKSSQDAWHIHCVEDHGLDYFLTADNALINQIRSISNRSLKKRLQDLVIDPSKLCEKLGVNPLTDDEIRSYAKDSQLWT